MIKNFEELKKQLAELSSVINSFKSEAVQQKIVDLIFHGSITPEMKEGEQSSSDSSGTKTHRSKKKRKSTQDESGKKSKKTGRVGPATVLTELIEEQYFNKPRTINELIAYCDKQKARKFKPNELSSPLARFVRNKKLNREKNADNQYEYTKKG